MNDSYVGFDKEIPLEFEVVQDDTTRVIEEYSKEDQDAIKAPSFFQAVVAQQLQEESSEEEGDEEEEEENPDEGEEAKITRPQKPENDNKKVNYAQEDFEKLKAKLKKAGLEKAVEKKESQLAK